MDAIDSFLEGFMREIPKHREVTHFLLFGSAARGTWRRRSDVDIVICLSENSKEVKEALAKKFWELDEKYDTGISGAHMTQPPIIFLWGWRKEAFKFFINNHLLMRAFRSFDPIHKKLKRLAPRYGQVPWITNKPSG